MLDKITLSIIGKSETDDYPYGRLRCTAYFWIEFKPNKGFRSGFQTINPKNNRLNAPKYSTYSKFCHLTRDVHTGHYETVHKGCGSFKQVQELAEYLALHSEALNLTNDMIKELGAYMWTSITANAQYIHTKFTNEDRKKQFLKLLEEPKSVLMRCFKFGENLFSAVNLDWQQIEDMKQETAQVN